MMKSLKKLILGVVAPIALAGMMSFTAFADDKRVSVDEFTISVPVTVETKEGVTEPENEYTVVIEPIKDAPMPAAVTENPLKKSGTVTFSKFGFTIPNNYEYKISLKSKELELLEADESSYIVTVVVTNPTTADGKLLAGMVVGHANPDETGKPEKLGFTCKYTKEPAKPTPPSGGGGGGGGNSSRKPSGDALIGDDNVPLAVLGAFEEDPIPLAVLPMTGDVTNMALWMLMFTFCTLGMAVTLLLRRKVA